MSRIIRLKDSRHVGVVLTRLREETGLSSREVARRIAEKTERSQIAIESQLASWKMANSTRSPIVKLLPPYLEVIKWDIAFIKRD